MTTEKVLSYFSKFQPLKVEWLNDSSCNVVFESEEYLGKAI